MSYYNYQNSLTSVANKPVPQGLAQAFNPTKAGTKKSHVIFVLDDSYSMQACRRETIDGFNGFLKKQLDDAKETGIKTFISLYKFDGSNVTCTIDRVSVKKVSPLNMDTYNPRGGTNLYDAMGGVFMKINEQLSAKQEAKRDSVIVTILTDGADNSSRIFDTNSVKGMVEKAEGANWGFMFLGANIDAFAVGGNLGFGIDNTMSYTVNNTKESMTSAANMTTRLRSAYMSGADTQSAYSASGFTDIERASSTGAKNV